MKKYFIWAYELAYNAANGIEDWYFIEASFKEACECGKDMSYDLIQAYSHQIFDNDDYREEDIEDDMAYEVWRLRDDAPDFNTLFAMNLTPQEYIKQWCYEE